jgi:hypothetical protein
MYFNVFTNGMRILKFPWWGDPPTNRNFALSPPTKILKIQGGHSLEKPGIWRCNLENLEKGAYSEIPGKS